MYKLEDYVLRLKETMDLAQGEDTFIDTEMFDINEMAINLKIEAKEELEDVGVTLHTDDITIITYVYKTMAVYLFRNDTNRIMDENEETIERFIALLGFSGVPEVDIPEILNNVVVDDKFNTILSLKYRDMNPPVELSDYSKFLMKKVTNEFKYIPPRKLIEGGIDKVFTLFDIEDLDPIEILYILGLFEIRGSEVHTVLADYPVDLNFISSVQNDIEEELLQVKGENL